MAWGLPVVAGDVGGLRDLVVDGKTGFLVPPGDVGAIRDALTRLLGGIGTADLRRPRLRSLLPPVIMAPAVNCRSTI